MCFQYMQNKLKEIKWWRWALLTGFLLIGLYTDIYNNLSNGRLSLIEVIVAELNDYFVICYYYLFAIVVIVSDIYGEANLGYSNQLFIRIGSRKKYWHYSFCYVLLISFIIVILIICCVIIIYLFITKGAATFTVDNLNRIGIIDYNLHSALFLSIILTICRFVFLNLGVFILNIKTNNSVGFLFAFLITIIDYWFYEIFQIMKPLFVLPIEHTRVVYTEAVAPAFDYMSRFNFLYSFIYWGVLILTEVIILRYFVLKKDFLNTEKIY